MEGISLIAPCFNRVEITMRFVASLQGAEGLRECILIDDCSADSTPDYLATLAGPFSYFRNAENRGLAASFNKGAELARGDVLVFMHNDVIIHDPSWPKKIRAFVMGTEMAGVVGLYGAKRIRSDGSLMGRGIMHAKAGKGTLVSNRVEVAVVDGLFMALKREVFEKIGRFDEGFVMHYYDKDLSLRSLHACFHNYVVNIPFTHEGAGTRSSVARETDESLRERMQRRFIQTWRHSLPGDVRSWSERLADWTKKYV